MSKLVYPLKTRTDLLRGPLGLWLTVKRKALLDNGKWFTLRTYRTIKRDPEHLEQWVIRIIKSPTKVSPDSW